MGVCMFGQLALLLLLVTFICCFLLLCAVQVTTELKAAGLLSGDFGPAAPLVARPLRIISDPDGGTFTISPYAGVCASKMRATAWKDFSPKQLEQKSQTLAVSLMLSQLLYSKLVSAALSAFWYPLPVIPVTARLDAPQAVSIAHALHSAHVCLTSGCPF